MLVSIDEKDSRPIYQQLASQIKDQISKGLLKTGDELPSVRELSDNLGINMHTVRRAYLELRDQGIINLRLGRKAKIGQIKPSSPVTDAKETIRTRFSELVTDAILSGYSPDDIRTLIENQLTTIDYPNTSKEQ